MSTFALHCSYNIWDLFFTRNIGHGSLTCFLDPGCPPLRMLLASPDRRVPVPSFGVNALEATWGQFKPLDLTALVGVPKKHEETADQTQANRHARKVQNVPGLSSHSRCIVAFITISMSYKRTQKGLWKCQPSIVLQWTVLAKIWRGAPRTLQLLMFRTNLNS